MDNILYDHIPCWYEIGWEESDEIVLRVNKKLKGSIFKNIEKHNAAKKLKEKHGANEFVSEPNERVGFKSCIKYREQGDKFITFTAPIPENKQDLLKVNSSLSILFNVLSFAKERVSLEDTPLEKPQLIKINTLGFIHEGIKNYCALGGYFSEAISEKINLLKEDDLEEIEKVMKGVYTKITKPHLGRFNASIKKGCGFIATCPGNACDIAPSHIGRIERDGGYMFSSHNLDTMLQQLTLLSSLAKLHDKVREI